MKKVYKSKENKILYGVIGGIGDYFNVDPTILRVFWIVITIFTGFFPATFAYIFATIIVPSKTT